MHQKQLLGIEQINDAVNSLDNKHNKCDGCTIKHMIFAVSTDQIAKLIVNSADEKSLKKMK